MLEIKMILILAAIWGAPALSTQADFKVSQISANGPEAHCSGQLSLDNRPGHQAVRVVHNCEGDGKTKEDLLLRMDQHTIYRFNHAEKTYQVQASEFSFDTILDDLIGDFKEKAETKPFLNGTTLITTPTNENFWLMQVKDPAQKNRLTEVHLIQPGLMGHLYLNYSSTPPAEQMFKLPQGYKETP